MFTYIQKESNSEWYDFVTVMSMFNMSKTNTFKILNDHSIKYVEYLNRKLYYKHDVDELTRILLLSDVLKKNASSYKDILNLFEINKSILYDNDFSYNDKVNMLISDIKYTCNDIDNKNITHEKLDNISDLIIDLKKIIK